MHSGADTRVQREFRPSTIHSHFNEEYGSFNQSLQPQPQYSYDTSLQSDLPTDSTNTALSNDETEPQEFQCSECPRSFATRSLLNKHFRKHDPPIKCTLDGCEKTFQWQRDCDRHRNTKHPQMGPGFTLWSCPYYGCKYSIQHSVGSPRKDNVNRHIRTKHGG